MKIPLIATLALSLMVYCVEAGFARQDWTGIPAIIPVPPPGDEIGPSIRGYGQTGRKDQVVDDTTVALIFETQKILDDFGLHNVSRLLRDLAEAMKRFINSQFQRPSWQKRASTNTEPKCIITEEMGLVC